jgi:DNA-binding IclR family transcriptional regulator
MPTQSVQRATDILKQFSASEPQLGVSELARRLGLTKSTVHRLLNSLCRAGLAEQDPTNRLYMLSRESVQLGYTAIYSSTLLRTAFPYLHYLAREAEETAYLAEREGDQALTVLLVLSPTLRDQLGWYKSMPLHSTSSGKVLLAYADDRQREAVLRSPLARRTENTITDPAELRAELEKVRQQGFATCFQEEKPGINAAAVPLRNPDGSVVAALAVAGAAYSLTREKATGSLEQLKAISGEITHKLGSAR